MVAERPCASGRRREGWGRRVPRRPGRGGLLRRGEARGGSAGPPVARAGAGRGEVRPAGGTVREQGAPCPLHPRAASFVVVWLRLPRLRGPAGGSGGVGAQAVILETAPHPGVTRASLRGCRDGPVRERRPSAEASKVPTGSALGRAPRLALRSLAPASREGMGALPFPPPPPEGRDPQRHARPRSGRGGLSASVGLGCARRGVGTGHRGSGGARAGAAGRLGVGPR